MARHGRHDHRQGLGVGQRLEQPPFLRLEREDGQEGDGDDEQREEAGRRDFLHRFDDHRLVIDGLARPAPFLQLLVRLLDDDDGRVHQLAHGDGDAAERHDVGRDPEHPERNERDEHGDGDGDDGNERARHVPQEEQHDEDDRQDDLDERLLDVVDGPLDQVRAVVDRDDLQPLAAGPARSP